MLKTINLSFENDEKLKLNFLVNSNSKDTGNLGKQISRCRLRIVRCCFHQYTNL